MDPPAYTASAPLHPTTTRRTIEDTRALILANATVIKRSKEYQPIELVTGKTRSPADLAAAAAQTRSFTSSKSNVTIRVNDAAGSSSSAAAERRASSTGGARVAGKHFAVLLYRTGATREMEIIVKGEPQDTVEEALEWMLDRTEIEVTEVLSRKWPDIGQ